MMEAGKKDDGGAIDDFLEKVRQSRAPKGTEMLKTSGTLAGSLLGLLLLLVTMPIWLALLPIVLIIAIIALLGTAAAYVWKRI